MTCLFLPQNISLKPKHLCFNKLYAGLTFYETWNLLLCMWALSSFLLSIPLGLCFA